MQRDLILIAVTVVVTGALFGITFLVVAVRRLVEEIEESNNSRRMR